MKIFFLITPFKSDSLFELKKSVIKRLAEKYNFSLLMANEESLKTGQYVRSSLEMIMQTDFVIADLSYERPSCYYELGYLQAMKKKVYLLAEQSTVIHQLLTPEQIIFYSNIKEYDDVINGIFCNENI